MKNIKLIFIIFLSILLTNCKTKNDFPPIDKRYWDANDYDKTILRIKYGYKPGEKLPSLNNSETRVIVEKLTDIQNINIILDDKELGINYKTKFIDEFLKNINDLSTIYRETDKKDKYIYDIELTKVNHFILNYFIKAVQVSNVQITESMDESNSEVAKNNIQSNIDLVIENFIYYLEELKWEKFYSKQGKILFSDGIDQYFPNCY